MVWLHPMTMSPIESGTNNSKAKFWRRAAIVWVNCRMERDRQANSQILNVTMGVKAAGFCGG